MDTAPLLQMPLVDWRVEDGESDTLSPAQREPWPATLRAGANGYTLDIQIPDGSVRTVTVERDGDSVVLRTYRQEIPDLKISLTATATRVESPENRGLLARRHLVADDETVAIHAD
jgi:hypothetical protein